MTHAVIARSEATKQSSLSYPASRAKLDYFAPLAKTAAVRCGLAV